VIHKYRELTVSNILKAVLPHPEIEKYLPDKEAKTYAVDQPFVLRIVKKIEPEYFTKIVDAARNARHEKEALTDKKASITMSKAVYDLLMSIPFTSVKKGRARKYLRAAVADAKKKPKRHRRFKVLPLTDFKTAKTANKLGEIKLVTKLEQSEPAIHGNAEMKSDSE